MTLVPRCTRSSIGAPIRPTAFRATPKMTARKMICRMSPSTNGSTMLDGTMWVRNSHQCWSSPFSMRALTVSEVSMVLTSALHAVAERDQVDRDQPGGHRQQGADTGSRPAP